MAEIVNLNKARKARQKTAKTVQADANRTRHGRTKAEKARDKAEAAQRQALLDGAKLDGVKPESDDLAD